jgi:hypothetical protein
MQMPTPTDAHKRMARLAGDWTGPENVHPSPWDPNGFKATGHSRNRVALDGFVVLHDYEQSRDGKVLFRGHGVFSFDPKAGHYLLHWFDVMGSNPNVYTGDFQGDVLSMTSPAHGGHTRCVFDLSQPNAYTFEMAMSQDGKSWKTIMDGRYTKSA